MNIAYVGEPEPNLYFKSSAVGVIFGFENMNESNQRIASLSETFEISIELISLSSPL